MIKKWLWVLIGIIVFMATGGFFHQPEIVPIVKNTPVQLSLPQLPPRNVNNTLLVDGEQLFAHVQKLNFRRYSQMERLRTRTYIRKELRKFGWQPQLEKFTDGVNIFSQRLGTDKTAGAILIAAHYDTVLASPGADDNATGIAVVLEIARLFSSVSTPKTLQLAFFDQEETGLLGSKAFVGQPAHLKNLQGVIIMDMLTLCALKRRRFYREFQSISLSYPSFRQGSLILGSCPDFVGPKRAKSYLTGVYFPRVPR